MTDRPRLDPGRVWLGAGLVGGGAGAYAYLALAGRALGAERFASLSSLWVVLNILGPGLFAPLELETSRAISHHLALGEGTAAVVRRLGRLAGWLTLGTAVVVLAAGSAIADTFYAGSWLMVLWTVLVVVLVAVASMSRGVFAGVGRLDRYGIQLLAESVLRAVVAAVLLGGGSHSPVAFGAALVVALGVAVAVTLRRPRSLVVGGPSTATEGLSRRLALLLAGSVLSYALLNSGPLVLQLGTSRDSAGTLLAGLQIARVPLFAFAAVGVVVLPRFSADYARGDIAGFRSVLHAVVLGLAGLGGLATVLGWALGPWVLSTFFGSGFHLSHRDMLLLFLGSAVFMVALAYSQALIAAQGFLANAVCWLVGFVVLAVVSGLLHGDRAGVEWGFLAGAAAALGVGVRGVGLRLAAMRA